jgi:hypothetical protein
MQNVKLILVLDVLILLVGAAAFIGSRLLTQRVGPAGSISVSLIPAVELPRTSPESTGPFIERRDNTIILETKSLDVGGVGSALPENARSQTGPTVEVVVTGETMIYRETTQRSEPLLVGIQTIQQTVEQARLDDLETNSMVMVWGRRSGDRIFADVLMFSDTVAIKSAIFEDCEVCP